MSMKLDAGDVRKSDLFLIDPREILVNNDHNGRAAPHSDEEISHLADSIYEHGQQCACVVRRVEGNKVQLVSGYGRYRAVMLLNQRTPDNLFPLKCVAVICNEEEAYLKNLVENNDRKSTNAIDDAHNQRRLREVFGWTEERIAAFYQKSLSHLSQLKKLLTLDGEQQGQVARGEMSVATALDVSELPKEQQQEVIDQATDSNTGKVKSGKVRERVREKRQQEGGHKARTLSEVRNYFDDLTVTGQSEGVKDLAKLLIEFITGRMDERKMENELMALVKEANTAEA